MSLRGRWATALLTTWIAIAGLIYFRQFAAPALLYLSRMMGHR